MRYINHRICSWLAVGAASFAIAPLGLAGDHFTEVSLAAGTYNSQSSLNEQGTVEATSEASAPSAEESVDSQVVIDIRQALPAVAHPSGPIQNCQDIAQSIRSSQQSHCLEVAIRRTLTCCNRESCEDNALVRQLAHTLAAKIEDEKIRKGLTAHVGIYATMNLARIQIESLERIDQYKQQQDAAIQNGIAIRDPQALQRLTLQTTDTAIQTIGANKNTRAQLAILVRNNVPCDYQPTLEACCVVPLQDLCELITEAQRHRPELQTLHILDAMLCEESADSCACCAAFLNSLSIVTAPCSVQPPSFVARILGKSKTDSQIQALRSAIQATKQIVQDKVASEVTDAWHNAASNQARLVLAQEIADAASRRVLQLQRISTEVSAAPETLIEADLALYKARGELIQREQEWQVSLIELAYFTGCL